jgi:hypothetical protein
MLKSAYALAVRCSDRMLLKVPVLLPLGRRSPRVTFGAFPSLPDCDRCLLQTPRVWPRESQYVLGAAAGRSVSQHPGVIATSSASRETSPLRTHHALVPTIDVGWNIFSLDCRNLIRVRQAG